MKLFNKLSKWINMKFTQEDKGEEKDVLEYKILVLGDRFVGKSSICNRLTLNEFNLEIKPTTQTECYTKAMTLFEQKIKLYIIDVDQNVMTHDRTHLYCDLKGVLLVYDVTKSKTFDKLENWLADLNKFTSNRIPTLMLGNKSDLTFLRNVDYEEGAEKSNSLNCDFCEASCVDMQSVREAFKHLVAKIYYNELPESKKNYYKIYYSGKNTEQNKEEEKNKENVFHKADTEDIEKDKIELNL